MLEQEVIQAKGFKNVFDGDRPIGFDVRVRTPYYRGVWLSLVEGAEVTVDGERFDRRSVDWIISGRRYPTDDLARATETRWPFAEPAVLRVAKPGGLAPGLHEVEVAITWRMSYMPIEMQPTTHTTRRKVTLVR